MPSYSRVHRAGLRYQRHVPNDVQDVAGASWWRQYISTRDGKSQAEATVRALAAYHDDWIATVRLMSPEQRAKVKAAGGEAKLDARRARLAWLGAERARARLDGAGSRSAFADIQRLLGAGPLMNLDTGEPINSAGDFLMVCQDTDAELAREEAALQAQVTSLEAVALKAAPVAEHSMSGLLALWRKVREPKCTAEHAATIKLYADTVGDVDYRHTLPADIQRFRDRIEQDANRSKKNQTRQLERLSALFAVAVSEGKMVSGLNPVRAVAVRGKKPRAPIIDQQAFTGAQTARILERAAATGFGAERHEAALWALRVLAWTGCRPNEVMQLQRGDVGIVEGCPVIVVRAINAAGVKLNNLNRNGKAHPLKSVKNEESWRIVPLHPSIAAGFLAFAAGDAAGFVFGAFPHNAQKGRAHWLSLNFGAFLRDVCGITADDGGRVSAYSFRHGFKAAMKRARIEEDNRKLLMGHSSGDDHGEYGGDDVRVLAADVARVDVLSD